MHQSLITVCFDDIRIDLTVRDDEIQFAQKSSICMQMAAKPYFWLKKRVFLYFVHLIQIKISQCAVNVYDDAKEDILCAEVFLLCPYLMSEIDFLTENRIHLKSAI